MPVSVRAIFSSQTVLSVNYERKIIPVSVSSCFGLGLDPFGGAFANALMMPPEVVRFIPEALVASGALTSKLHGIKTYDCGTAATGLVSGGGEGFFCTALRGAVALDLDAAVPIFTVGAT